MFREADIGRAKSITAAGAVSAMNPSLNIKPYEAKCAQETEELFSDDFYSGLSVRLINIKGYIKGALAGVQYMLRSHRNTTHPVHDTVDQDT